MQSYNFIKNLKKYIFIKSKKYKKIPIHGNAAAARCVSAPEKQTFLLEKKRKYLGPQLMHIQSTK
jgi:hypothetical protein